MITITINDEKEDKSRSVWTLQLKDGNIGGPLLIALIFKIFAENGFEADLKPLKIKT